MSKIIIVLGMHRSGTSAMAGLLAAAGAQVGAPLVPANAGNPTGYWELERMVALNDRLLASLDRSWLDISPLPPGWEGMARVRALDADAAALIDGQFAGAAIAVCKDPRICLTFPFWRRALLHAGMALTVVVLVRPVAEVMQSLVARDGLSPTTTAYLWARSTHGALRATFDEHAVITTFDQLLATPGAVLERIAAAAGHTLDLDAATFVDPVRRHWRNQPLPDLPAPLVELCAQMYADANEAAMLGARLGSVRFMQHEAALASLDATVLPQLQQAALTHARQSVVQLAGEVATARVAHAARDEREQRLRLDIAALEARVESHAIAGSDVSVMSGTGGS